MGPTEIELCTGWYERMMVQGSLALSKYATPETAADGAGEAVQSGYYLALGAAGALFR